MLSGHSGSTRHSKRGGASEPFFWFWEGDKILEEKKCTCIEYPSQQFGALRNIFPLPLPLYQWTKFEYFNFNMKFKLVTKQITRVVHSPKGCWCISRQTCSELAEQLFKKITKAAPCLIITTLHCYWLGGQGPHKLQQFFFGSSLECKNTCLEELHLHFSAM